MREPDKEPRLSGLTPNPTIGYRLLRLEVPDQKLGDLYEGPMRPDDIRREDRYVQSEADLPAAVGRWLDDPSLLRHPGAVDHLVEAACRLGLVVRDGDGGA